MAPLLNLRRVPRLIIALGLALVLAVPSALAQRGDPIFTVGGVLIEASGPDPMKARDKALVDGEKKAFDLLIRRLIAEADVEKLPPVEPGQLETMVSGFEFENERPSANRYVATLRVAFVPDQIRGYLRGAGVASSSASPSAMIRRGMRRKVRSGAIAMPRRWGIFAPDF